MTSTYFKPSSEQFRKLTNKDDGTEKFMLNLLRFRDIADYSNFLNLAPQKPISGREAYKKYLKSTGNLLKSLGGKLIFLGEGQDLFIGPTEEKWDMALIVKYPSIKVFTNFITNPEYLSFVGHRTAAVEDSRLLPLNSKFE